MKDRSTSGRQSDKEERASDHDDLNEREPAPRGSTGRNEQDPSAVSAQREDMNRNERDHSDDLAGDFHLEETLNSLEEEDETAGRTRGTASYSETDEDEDEGLGDGNIGRSVNSPGLDEEG